MVTRTERAVLIGCYVALAVVSALWLGWAGVLLYVLGFVAGAHCIVHAEEKSDR